MFLIYIKDLIFLYEEICKLFIFDKYIVNKFWNVIIFFVVLEFM